ncbi:GNAT family N-acetyltransferase [Planktotalea arctica]|uniref:GNAT family N-acetyltransferase n=1 Tax=Planktotalea arctica TaxID=1481893 RepID=UPI003218E085
MQKTAGDEATAKVRPFLLLPNACGKGLGAALLSDRMSFAKSHGYARMNLWTHESDKAACVLYARIGWNCAACKVVTSFGVELLEQQWEITL